MVYDEFALASELFLFGYMVIFGYESASRLSLRPPRTSDYSLAYSQLTYQSQLITPFASGYFCCIGLGGLFIFFALATTTLGDPC